MNRRTNSQSGFSFIEILVVMGIISVLVSMVVVVVPLVQEHSKRTKSQDNIGSLAKYMISVQVQKGWKAFPYNGKNFTLSPLVMGVLDRRNRQNLEILFSPGDAIRGLESVDMEKYKQMTKDSLKRGSEDYSDFTSYAGRRNKDREFRITPDDESRGVLILCDDDDGPIHHKAGFVAVNTAGAVRFYEWEEFGLIEPDNPKEPEPWLGDDAQNEELSALSSR